ncbi:hypothetical protein FIU95_18290 [Microbulbifer sp. THAF38]|nr:hypothetical protein FIU95_18290 [Microbulbifer sp. THAF38]
MLYQKNSFLEKAIKRLSSVIKKTKPTTYKLLLKRGKERIHCARDRMRHGCRLRAYRDVFTARLERSVFFPSDLVVTWQICINVNWKIRPLAHRNLAPYNPEHRGSAPPQECQRQLSSVQPCDCAPKRASQILLAR